MSTPEELDEELARINERLGLAKEVPLPAVPLPPHLGTKPISLDQDASWNKELADINAQLRNLRRIRKQPENEGNEKGYTPSSIAQSKGFHAQIDNFQDTSNELSSASYNLNEHALGQGRQVEQLCLITIRDNTVDRRFSIYNESHSDTLLQHPSALRQSEGIPSMLNTRHETINSPKSASYEQYALGRGRKVYDWNDSPFMRKLVMIWEYFVSIPTRSLYLLCCVYCFDCQTDTSLSILTDFKIREEVDLSGI